MELVRTCKLQLKSISRRHGHLKLPNQAHSWTAREPLETSLAPMSAALRGRNKRQLKVLLRNEMAERLHFGDELSVPDARGPRDSWQLNADQRQLTSKIRACSHARELHTHLVHAGPRVVNAVHVGLAFQKVAQLHPGGKCITG